MTLDLNAFQRLILVNTVLPETGGSLREALAIRKLRKRVQLTEEEAKQIDAGENRINVKKATELVEEFEFSDAEADVIAVSLKGMEEVPTNDYFLDLAEHFMGRVEAIEL